jgi:hypothetical protein
MSIFKFNAEPAGPRKGLELYPLRNMFKVRGAGLGGDDMGGFSDGLGEGAGFAIALIGVAAAVTYFKKLKEKP